MRLSLGLSTAGRGGADESMVTEEVSSYSREASEGPRETRRSSWTDVDLVECSLASFPFYFYFF